MSGTWIVAMLVMALIVLLFLVYEARPRPREFKEPGSGQWMLIPGPRVQTQWWALSDSGAKYDGGPWISVLEALSATRYNFAFKRQYDLLEDDVTAPHWNGTGWDTDWARCNLLRGEDLYKFWQSDMVTLEVR